MFEISSSLIKDIIPRRYFKFPFNDQACDLDKRKLHDNFSLKGNALIEKFSLICTFIMIDIMIAATITVTEVHFKEYFCE